MSQVKRPRLRDRIRRVQFIIGLGFGAAVIGALFSSLFIGRLHFPRGVLAFIVVSLISQLWILIVLPLLCYGVGRIVELHPWRSPLGAALTGEVFFLAVGFVSAGTDGVLQDWPRLLVSLIGFCGGLWLSHWAILRAGKTIAEGNARAARLAVSRKAEYDEYLKASEAIANRQSPVSNAPVESPEVKPDPEAAPGSADTGSRT